MALLVLSDISVGYGDEPDILRDISLAIEPNETVFVAGSNGEGKTTLLKIASGLLKPRAGHRQYSGQRAPGLLFQDPARQLLCSTVREEIEFSLRISGTDEKYVGERTDKLLQDFALSSHQDAAPSHLSGGQQQRLALAALMSCNPELMLLDEPDAFLDGRSRREFREFYFAHISCATCWAVSRMSEIPSGYRSFELVRGVLREIGQ